MMIETADTLLSLTLFIKNHTGYILQIVMTTSGGIMRRLIAICVILLTISLFAEDMVEMDVPDYKVYVGETEMVDAKYPLLNYRHMVIYLYPMIF